jgi:small subunit ribosomal protein S6
LEAYEGLFLVDDKKASEDAKGIEEHVRGLLERHHAEVDSFEKWESRRLAYEVDGKRRGAYFVCRFRAETMEIAAIHREFRISTTVLRAMILRQENLGQTFEEAEQAYNEKKRARAAALLEGKEESEGAASDESAGEREPAEATSTPSGE